MVDLVVRGLDSDTVQFLGSMLCGLSREAYLRNLIEGAVEEEKFQKGFLVPNLKDLQKSSSQPHATCLNLLQELYEKGLISYPLTASRYIISSDWKDSAQIVKYIVGEVLEISAYPHKLAILRTRMLRSNKPSNLHSILEQMIERGYPAPQKLYNDKMCIEHAGITPLVHEGAKLYQLSDDALTLYSTIVEYFINAVWNNLDENVKAQRFLENRCSPTSEWIPFREKASGKIIAARWCIRSERFQQVHAQGWEVAGEGENLIAREQAAQEWETL